MHVIARRPQITVAAALHRLRLVAAAENVPEQLVPVIEPDGVGALQPGHPGHQVGVGGFQHQMVVVGHQAISLHLPTCFQARLSQGLDEIVPVHIIQKDVLAPVPPAHHMIHGTGIFNASLAWHELKVTSPGGLVNQNAMG